MALGIAALALAGCAGLARSTDERAINARADNEAAALAKRVRAYDEPRLAEYLATVAGRLLQGRIDDVRLIVIEDPTSAAFILPNGRLYVHTGLLSRVENEAQLATILARELARRPSGRARGAAVVPAMTGPLPHGDLSPTAAAILGLDLRLAAVAAIRGYGASPEREADAEALRLLTSGGYDGGQALRMFERLAGGSRDRGPIEIFFYGNRPRMGERYEAIRALLGATAPSPAADSSDVGAPTFEQRMRRVVRDNAALDLRAGRFGLAREQLDRVLATAPNDPIAQVYYGDLERLRSQRAAAAPERAELARQALARYQRALELDPGYAEPLRQLGLLYYQERDVARARAAFERYLAAAPDAADARRIREYLAVVGE